MKQQKRKMNKSKKTTNNKARNFWRRLLLVAAGLLFGVNVYYWNAGILGGNALPMPFGIGSAVVMSGSMEPTLSVNDLVYIREADEYAVGDVVVYQSGNDLIIHEIVDITGDLITTKGEANNTADEPISRIYIKGRMVLAIPYVGAAVQFVKSLPGTILLLGAAILLIELSWNREKTGKEKEMDAIKAEIRLLQKELRHAGKGDRQQ